MAVINAFGWTMITMDFRYSEKYWTIVSDYVKNKFGDKEITEPQVVQETLKGCFQILGDKFGELIEAQNLASFYLFVHNFHENSIELWKKQLEGQQLPMNESDFAVIRRVLKIIMEQGCANNLVGCPSFRKQLYEKRFEFKKYLEELLYLGYQSIVVSDYIARSQLFPKSIGFQIIESELNILTYSPYKFVYEYIDKDIPKHNSSVEVSNTIKEFQGIWKDELGVDYGVLGSIILEQERNLNYRFSVIKYNSLIENIVETHKYDKSIVQDFYSGMMISKENKLTFEECILRSQDIRRHLYRPIVKLNIDNEEYCLIGMNKWLESFTSLTSNALPFGVCPVEWKKHKPISKFIKHLQHTHDRILEDPAILLLTEKNIKNDRNVKSIRTKKGNNISIIKKGVGEIDIVFVNEAEKSIYVCECKHNRSRFDLFNWRRDYHNFKDSYETQLTNKVNWTNENKILLLEHIELKYGTTILNKDEYIPKGIFIINAPTIYMYDCLYPTLTLHNFEELINGNYQPGQFIYTDENEKEHIIELPYFQNFDKVVTAIKNETA